MEDCCRIMLEQLLERGTRREEPGSETGNVASEALSARRKVGDTQSAADENSLGGEPADEIPQPPLAAWPRAAQSSRVRAVLPMAEELPRSRVQAQDKPAPITGTLHSNSEQSKQPWLQSEPVQPGLRQDVFAPSMVADARMNNLPPASATSNNPSTTAWDNAAAPAGGLASAARSASPVHPGSAVVAPKAQLRAPQVREVAPSGGRNRPAVCARRDIIYFRLADNSHNVRDLADC